MNWTGELANLSPAKALGSPKILYGTRSKVGDMQGSISKQTLRLYTPGLFLTLVGFVTDRYSLTGCGLFIDSGGL